MTSPPHRERRPLRRRASASSPLAVLGRHAASLPYVLVFLVFVLYPVGYGLWLARHPAKLRQARSTTRSSSARSINTLVFLIVAINLKMVVALVLSGFFVQHALVDQGRCR